MSEAAKWFPSTSRTLSTRLVMIGAFVGAMLVLGMSVVFSSPGGVSAGTPAEQEKLSQAQAAEEAFEAPTGSCLTWSNEDGSDIHKVSCDESHLFEITNNVDIAADNPPSAPSPTVERWREIAEEKCAEGATAYLDGKLDPFGKFSVGALKPSDEQWRKGDRKLRCGLQRAAPSGKLVATRGQAAKADQSDVYDVGTCLALDNGNIGDPIDCTKGHAYEIVALVNLGKEFPDGFPSEDKQKDKLSVLCEKAAKDYSGGIDLAERRLILTWDTRKKESWEAGSRTTACKVGALQPDGKALAPVTGSIKAVGGTSGSNPPNEPTEPTPGG